MKKRNMMKKGISLLLTLCMVLTLVPTTAFAVTTDNLCDHHSGHTAECGYAEGVSECTYVCGESHEEEPAEEPAEEPSDEAAPVCDCGTDDALIHATTCAVYVAPENPVCKCAMKCTEPNEWCDICGFDIAACTGTDTAAVYADEWFTVSGNTLTIDGTLGGKAEATDEDITALTNTIKSSVDNGITTIIVTGSELAIYNGFYDNYPAYAEALYYVTEEDENSKYCGSIDLILPDVTEIGKHEYNVAFSLKSVTLPKVTTIGDAAFWECLYLQTLTFGSVVTSISSKVAFADVGFKVEGGTDLVLNCGQMQTEGNYKPNLETNEWGYDSFWEEVYKWESITLTHTPVADDGDCTTAVMCSACGEIAVEAKESHTTELAENKATCQNKAKCDLCGTEYGEVGGHSFNSADGKCGDCKVQAAASVTIGENTTYYETLTEAATVAQTGTEAAPAILKLEQSVDLGSECLQTFSGVFTLDLNGKTLSSSKNNWGALRIGGGSVTITDTGEGGTITHSTFYGIAAREGCTVTIEGGTIIGYYVGVDCMESTVIINGGTIIGKNEYGVQVGNPTDDVTNSTVTINGGTITGSKCDLYNSRSTILLGLGENGIGATFPDGLAIIQKPDGFTLKDILGEGAAYWQDGKMLTVADDATSIDGTVTVMAECKHENATYSDITDTQHTMSCSCGYEVTEEHTFDENGKCTACGADCTHKSFTDGKCEDCGITGGYCGAATNEGGEESVIWTYDEVTKAFAITGTGAMEDYNSYSDRPWDGSISENATSVTISEGVTRIGKRAFQNFRQITAVTVPASVESIGSCAFTACKAQSITFAEGSRLTAFDDFVFQRCTALKQITLPAGVTSVDSSVFSGCNALTDIFVEEGSTTLKDIDGVLYTADGTTLLCYPSGKDDTAFTTPAGVTTIGECAFRDNVNLETITIFEGVTTIGEWAFQQMRSLTTVTIPSSVTSIGYDAFESCENLTTINAPCNWDNEDPLYTFDSTVDVIVGDHTPNADGYTVNENGTHSFVCSDCRNEVTEEHTFDETGKCTVCGADCTHETFTDGKCDDCGITGGYCGAATNEGGEESVIWTYDEETKAFAITGTGAMEDYNSYSDRPWDGSISENATSVTISEGVTRIGKRAFQRFTQITAVTVPASVESIGYCAFTACKAQSITFAEGSRLTAFDHFVFQNCTALKQITLPAGVTSVHWSVFSGCYALTDIFVEEGSTTLKDIDGVLYTADGTTLLLYPLGKKDTAFTTPAGVTTIGEQVFEDNVNLKTITLSEGVTIIGARAFWCMESLTTVTIPSSVTSIGYDAFESCENLTTINAPCNWDNEDPLYTFDSTVDVIVGDHTPNADGYTVNENGTHSFVCSDCRNEVTEEHTLLTCSASGNVITGSCSKCPAVDTATITAENTTYNGTAQETATVAYSAGWKGGELTVSYANNTNAGTATASITIGEATASVEFTIAKALIDIYTDNLINPEFAEGLIYNGTAQALVTNSGSIDGGYIVFSLNPDGEYTTEIPVATEAGEYVVYYRIEGDENHYWEGSSAFEAVTIAPKEVTVKLTDAYKEYDGTNLLTTFNMEVEGFIFYDEGSYESGVLDYDDIYDDVRVDAEKLTVTLPGCTVGQYTTATISNIKLIGEDAANYTIAEELVVEIEDFEISPMTVYITPMDQVLSEGQDIDPDAYDLDKELPEGHTLTGVQLAVDEEYREIYVAKDENDNIVGLKVTNASGEDVTDCFNFDSHETGKLTRTHQGHSFNADGFCATGECKLYQPANAGTNEFGETVYEIGNAGQLYWFAELVNVDGDRYACGRLVSNILIPADAPNWVPIGGYSEWAPYTGAFDGQGHTISGLKCETTGKYAGLFGYTDYSNTIQNIGILNSSFKGTQYVGGLIGSGYTTVTNCYVANTTVEGTGSDVGGFMGYNGGQVSNCFAYADTLMGHNSGTVENSYYLSDTETEDGGKTAEQFASGEMVSLLGEAWGQTIGTDLFPTLGGPKVNYGYTTCDAAQTEKVYSNETAYDEKPDHSWSEWQETKPATGTSEGEETRTCTVCKLEEKRSIDKLKTVFVDVVPGAYYETPVMWAVENGITNGVDETHFAPDAACSRAQVITFLWRAAGSPEPSSANNPFADVSEGSFYYKAVLWAAEKGIANGVDETHFAPNASCTRAQAVTFLWRFRGNPASGGNNTFTDVAPGTYYYNAVLWAVENGIANGMGDGTFGTASPCNRGQIVTFLYRTIG